MVLLRMGWVGGFEKLRLRLSQSQSRLIGTELGKKKAIECNADAHANARYAMIQNQNPSWS